MLLLRARKLPEEGSSCSPHATWGQPSSTKVKKEWGGSEKGMARGGGWGLEMVDLKGYKCPLDPQMYASKPAGVSSREL